MYRTMKWSVYQPTFCFIFDIEKVQEFGGDAEYYILKSGTDIDLSALEAINMADAQAGDIPSAHQVITTTSSTAVLASAAASSPDHMIESSDLNFPVT